MNKPFSAACERNRNPILSVLRTALHVPGRVLEIGSGTGQHAVHFGAHLPHLQWQTSDLEENHAGIRAWLDEAQLANISPPICLDMSAPDWPQRLPSSVFSAVYTANTCHILSWRQVESMIAGVGSTLPFAGLLCIYGPFNYGGLPTSQGNADFDAALRADVPYRGIRDIEAILALAATHGLYLQSDHPMPTNNRLLIFQRMTFSD